MIETEQIGAILIFSLNRPTAKNALSCALVDELAKALQEAEANPDVKIIVLTGGENFFAAGADIAEMRELDREWVESTGFAGSCEALAKCGKPLIAMVYGYALGGGLEMIEMCDLVIAEKEARFAHPEITLGLMSGAGGTWRLPRVVGKHKAMDMLLTGRMINAEEAYIMGLVSRIFSKEELRAETLKIAALIASYPEVAVKEVKAAVLRALSQEEKAGLQAEKSAFHRLLNSPEAQTRLKNFGKK